MDNSLETGLEIALWCEYIRWCEGLQYISLDVKTADSCFLEFLRQKLEICPAFRNRPFWPF